MQRGEDTRGDRSVAGCGLPHECAAVSAHLLHGGRGVLRLVSPTLTLRARLQLQLTQAVARAEDGSVSHLATVRWDDCGAPVATVHTNFLAPTGSADPQPIASRTRRFTTAVTAAAAPTAPAPDPATKANLNAPQLPTPTTSSHAPAYPYLSPRGGSRAWPAVGRGPTPQWHPRTGTGASSLCEATNANVLKQLCGFHFERPMDGTYWLTWQRFHLLARWRCAPAMAAARPCSVHAMQNASDLVRYRPCKRFRAAGLALHKTLTPPVSVKPSRAL